MRSNSVKITCSAKLKDIQNNIEWGSHFARRRDFFRIGVGIKKNCDTVEPRNNFFQQLQSFSHCVAGRKG